MDWLFRPLQPLFTPAYTFLGSPITWLEIVAFVLAIAMVLFNIRVDPRGWPLAIASSLLYFALFWNSRLYGDASLQIVFVLLASWGWSQWLRGTEASDRPLRIRMLSTRGLWASIFAMALIWPAIGLLLANFTNSDVPWWDAFPTAGSIVGQWLLARKYIENWATWMAVNTVSVGLFAYKGLWLTVVLYGIFVIMSFMGWTAWRRSALRGI